MYKCRFVKCRHVQVSINTGCISVHMYTELSTSHKIRNDADSSLLGS